MLFLKPIKLESLRSYYLYHIFKGSLSDLKGQAGLRITGMGRERRWDCALDHSFMWKWRKVKMEK